MLKNIHLQNFRCFQRKSIDLSPAFTVFYGANAVGKTSILEAICILLRLSSPLTSTLSECIIFNENFFSLMGNIDTTCLSCAYKDKKMSLSIDKIEEKSKKNYLSYSSIVWLGNRDIELVRGGSNGRRRYLDFFLTQADVNHSLLLSKYRKALSEKNYILKLGNPKIHLLKSYNNILAENGDIITKNRRKILGELTKIVKDKFSEISKSKINISFEFQPGFKDNLLKEYDKNIDQEILRKRTIIGSHLDDFLILINGKRASRFASEGQERAIAISLKLAQSDLLKKKLDKNPILLVDDIFGELDLSKRNSFLQAISNDTQKIVTTTNLDWIYSMPKEILVHKI